MSCRTKLTILSIFVVLCGIPAGYLAITWHPASPLTFHLESTEPTVGNDNKLGSYRARRVRIGNTSPGSIEFHGATLLSQGGAIVFRDAPPGMVLAQSLTQSDRGASVLVIPANGHVVADALLLPELISEVPKGQVWTLYRWQSSPRSSIQQWLLNYGPRWLTDRVPKLKEWEEVIPLEGGP
ncbi:hypothetical protein DES53_115126 [Roseimicrobium gellanilyticum]|uniref:Uncharacterized protein n=1 Tax=Roseimicrobium gellanilyticum TaxID=748857 RepID=A0A366H4P6_9BACT|nr:hypothetical protein [Roseimicrobium gellanilyticum]RBP36985.1 hypothetical protein DES53_115126 [Roseimicrobium gellanilyticum]